MENSHLLKNYILTMLAAFSIYLMDIKVQEHIGIEANTISAVSEASPVFDVYPEVELVFELMVPGFKSYYQT